MIPRFTLAMAAALVIGATLTSAAHAAAPLEDVGLKDVQGILKTIENVDIGRERATITLRDSEPMTIDYGGLFGGSGNIKMLSYAAVAALGLGLLGSLLRILRMIAGMLRRPSVTRQ